MNHYKRNHVSRLMLALAVGLSILGCASPVSAKPVNLDTSQAIKLQNGDTLSAKPGNLYNIDRLDTSKDSLYMSSDPSVASVMHDNEGNVVLATGKPGKATVYLMTKDDTREYQIVVR